MTSPSSIRIATRQSPLALWQAAYVKERLLKLYPDLDVALVTFTTRGDRILDTSLSKIGGKGLFVKELEHALLDGTADIAVHSMKDVPMDFPPGLGLGAICEREDPHDAFVSNRFSALDELPPGARVGTSSLRRHCQLKQRRPDLEILDLRGNVQTRLDKLDRGDFDAIILAAAGLRRLALPERIAAVLPATVSLPAAGQGAIGIEMRTKFSTRDEDIRDLLKPLNHYPTDACVSAERALNRRLNGGCQVPVACFGVLQENMIHLRGLVGSVDGSTILRTEGYGMPRDPDGLGIRLAEDLLAQGADRILAPLRGTTP